MNRELQMRHEPGRHVSIMAGPKKLLWRYVYVPETPANEASRPYAHPVCNLAGDVLTNFRPTDHPWHHGLSLTLTRVDDLNFWGGPTYRPADGYQWRDDHGVQVHRAWLALSPERLEESLHWCEPKSGRVLLEERRELLTSTAQAGWSLRWISELRNVTARRLQLGNYHSIGSLAGSHYTGLQFRGARDLLDQHGDATIGVFADGGLVGEGSVHGALTRWMEWSCMHDGSLRRTRIRFENADAPLPWFVRTTQPIATFAFHRDEPRSLAPRAVLRFDHVLKFTSA